MILSKFFNVLSLWAIDMIVLSLIFSKDPITLSSVIWSSALVASSKIITAELLYMALAIPSLCFCPPLKLIPFSPVMESYLSGLSIIKSIRILIF